MKIGGIQKLTLIDYPGFTACIVFLSGCNFRCPWCHSPELVIPEVISDHPEISEKEILSFLDKRKGLLDGVVVCGGEPTVNRDLPQLLKKIKDIGFKIKLDTNGSNPAMLGDLISRKLIDYIAMDIKAPFSSLKDTQKYTKIVGVKIKLKEIKDSIKIIKVSGIDYEFRTTVIPSLHTKEDIKAIAKMISPAKKYFIQRFRPNKNINSYFHNLSPYSENFMDDIVKEIKGFFDTCEAR